MANKRTRTRSTSWDAVADWYGTWMGRGGDRYHRLTLIPQLLELLQPQAGERILDIGCGQGAVVPHVAKSGAQYVGVDLSPRMIEAARKYRSGRFVVGDAADLTGTSHLRPDSFDAAFFLVSIQDMEPLQDVLLSAAAVLKPEGRLIVLTTHPAFQVPRQSGWGWDPERRLRYRRVDSYLTPFVAPMPPRPDRGRTQTLHRFHRPISVYVNTLVDAGFVIEHISEVPAHRSLAPPAHRRAAERSRQEIPLFLGIRARKLRTKD